MATDQNAWVRWSVGGAATVVFGVLMWVLTMLVNSITDLRQEDHEHDKAIDQIRTRLDALEASTK